MKATKNITLDLLETGSPVIIKAKQNDRNTRYIAAHLYVDGLAYPVPSGTEIAFRYKKPDDTAGFYDALPDNSPAITVSGNTVTVELVEQVLTVAGFVCCEINMYNAASEKLTTFTFEISVEESVLTDAEIISSDYYNVLTAEIAKALQAVTDATEQAENAAQSAQDAADSAAMSKDWAAGQPVTYSGTPVSIAYAGAQRIASITAYGENAQGGTTEAPVALTGISSITVNDDVTELPIPRPLHKVGDVRDVCRTRVKSVYDKRIVLDGAEDWKMGSAVGGGAPYIFCDLLNDHYQAFPIISSRFPSTNILTSNKNQGIGCWDRSLYLRYDSLFTNVEELKTYLSAHPLTVYYQSTAYDGTNGLDVCLMKYQTGFVELDGETLAFTTTGNSIYWNLPRGSSPGIVSGPHIINSHFPSNVFESNVAYSFIFSTKTKMKPYFDTVEALNAYLAAQKSAGTPVQIAYQLAAPEVYATDPVDFDNAAGPLTVIAGGEVEVRMTELIGSRSDVSNNTVAFSEASQDADIQTGEKLSVLFGKIKKRFSVVNKLVNGAVYPNLLDNSDFTNLVNQRGEAVYDYLTGIGYGPDRWQLVEAKYTLASQTVTSAGSSHTYGSQLRQIIPLEKIKIGDTVTASISTESGILNGTAKLELKIDTSVSDLPYVIEQDWGGVKIGCIKENVCHVIVFLKENKSVKINWVKLEKGGVATPYVPKGYGAELAECLRYFQRVHADWRIYPTLKDMLYRFSQSTLQVMRIKPTISAHGTPYTFGCTINALDAQPMAFTVETKITEQGQNAAAASMLGYFDLSADL